MIADPLGFHNKQALEILVPNIEIGSSFYLTAILFRTSKAISQLRF